MGYFLLPTSPQHIFSTPLPCMCMCAWRKIEIWGWWHLSLHYLMTMTQAGITGIFLHAILLNQLTQVNEPSISSFYSFWHPLLFQIHKNIRSWHCSGFWWKLQFLYLDEKTNIHTSWPLQTSAGGSWTSRQVAEDPWDFPRYVLCSGAPQLPPWKQAGSLHWSAKDEPWDWPQHSLDSFLSKGICLLGFRNLSLSVWNLLHV